MFIFFVQLVVSLFSLFYLAPLNSTLRLMASHLIMFSEEP